MRNIRWVYYKLTGFKLNLAYCFFLSRKIFWNIFIAEFRLDWLINRGFPMFRSRKRSGMIERRLGPRVPLNGRIINWISWVSKQQVKTQFISLIVFGSFWLAHWFVSFRGLLRQTHFRTDFDMPTSRDKVFLILFK